MKNIPDWDDSTTIKVLGNIWSVRIVDHPLVVNGEDVWGYTNFETQEIVLSNRGNVLAHFLHEINHVIGSVTETTVSGEEAVERIAQATLSVLVDNLEFFQGIINYLQEEYN